MQLLCNNGYVAQPRTLNLDRIGVVASTLCAIHCVVVALAFGLLPVLGLAFLKNPWTDWLFVAVAGLVGGPAMILGYRKHHKPLPLALFGLALGVVLFGLLGMAHEHEAGHFDIAHVVTTVGGLILVAAHLLNQKLSHTCCGKLACPHQK